MTDGVADDIEAPLPTTSDPRPDPFTLVDDFSSASSPRLSNSARPESELLNLLAYRKKQSHDDLLSSISIEPRRSFSRWTCVLLMASKSRYEDTESFFGSEGMLYRSRDGLNLIKLFPRSSPFAERIKRIDTLIYELIRPEMILIGALSLAGLRNVSPGPSVGFGCVLRLYEDN